MSEMRNPEFARRRRSRILTAVFPACLTLAVMGGPQTLQANDSSSTPAPTFRQYCLGCHSDKAKMGGLSLEQLLSDGSMGEHFQHWEKVAMALEEKRMPPQKLPQPNDEQRTQAVRWIRAKLNEYALKNAGDPGPVTVRRLTSGEYAYTIQDLTGLKLNMDDSFAGDSVGGEGFTNFGDVQFIDDATLERYLDTAKKIAAHAVIGSGPLQFFEDPGKTGLELSAIHRIQNIYTTHGFRAVSGEGGKPYGLELYTKAFYAAWRYQHRAALGEPDATMEQIGAREGVSAQFIRHIWEVLHLESAAYPMSAVISKFNSLPAPTAANRNKVLKDAWARCDELQEFVTLWPRWLFGAGDAAEGGLGDERSFDLTDASLAVKSRQPMRFFVRGRRQRGSASGKVELHFTVTSVNPESKDRPVVIWRNPMVRAGRRAVGPEAEAKPPQPLIELLDEQSRATFNFGKHPNGGSLAPTDFAMAADTTIAIDLPMPEDGNGLALQVEVSLEGREVGDAIVRATLSDRPYVVLKAGAPQSALLGFADAPGFEAWKENVLWFADHMPQNSQGETTPADKDPIPPPFNNTYNQPERDRFHLKVKYHRADRFIYEKILDDDLRRQLDQAWNDLLASFEYHDAFFDFVADKYNLESVKGKDIGELTQAEIDALPEEPRKFVKALREEFEAVHAAQRAAEPGHVEDAVRFAGQAWRRPLSKAEQGDIRNFYAKLRKDAQLTHESAVRAVLARILVAPSFLYRFEQTLASAPGIQPLSDWDLASRLSYFLWSSMPDAELRRAAAAGELRDPNQLSRQVSRMLADPKARRFATEFFGQWLGFYRFDDYRGVDTSRFPEFTEEVKKAMYKEAVYFFDHIIRKDRPVREMLFANYTFLNRALAQHYGVTREIPAADEPVLVENANEFQRGGFLRLGAVLTTTSAPLRTSPVKRGDWMLRRVLGTPTPPPPPDAGSIPADENHFGGLSLAERLAAHQRNATCAGCHSRIDPLGFPLERFDAIGRWRETYADGKPVHDSSELADKTPLAGVDGLLEYLKSQEEQILKTFSQKLLGYALGRTMLISDQPLIQKLIQAGGNSTFSQIAAEIVTSRQFRYRREPDTAPATPPRQTAKDAAVKNSHKEGGL